MNRKNDQLFRHAMLLRDANYVGVTVTDLARAWASIDGKREKFDAGMNVEPFVDMDGTYGGYICETEEVLRRATGYALERKKK